MHRLTLIPGLPRLWRGPAELQLGADPARALVIRLPDPRLVHVLDLLDGSGTRRSVLLGAAELGLPVADTHALISALEAAGLVRPLAELLPGSLPHEARRRLTGEAAALALRDTPVPAPAAVLRQRGAAQVVITGRGRLGAPIAVALAEAGVGHVRPEQPGAVVLGELAGGPLRGADVGRPRQLAICDAVSRAAPGTHTFAVRKLPASLVVQLDHDEPVNLVAAVHSGHRQPHLSVTLRHGVAVIGPLVTATGAPCLNCLDLHRLERDRGWPGQGRAVDEPCEVSTLLAAVAYATAEILLYLDGGEPETLGGSAEITGPGRIRRRTWLPHPACPCSKGRRKRI